MALQPPPVQHCQPQAQALFCPMLQGQTVISDAPLGSLQLLRPWWGAPRSNVGKQRQDRVFRAYQSWMQSLEQEAAGQHLTCGVLSWVTQAEAREGCISHHATFWVGSRPVNLSGTGTEILQKLLQKDRQVSWMVAGPCRDYNTHVMSTNLWAAWRHDTTCIKWLKTGTELAIFLLLTNVLFEINFREATVTNESTTEWRYCAMPTSLSATSPWFSDSSWDGDSSTPWAVGANPEVRMGLSHHALPIQHHQGCSPALIT